MKAFKARFCFLSIPFFFMHLTRCNLSCLLETQIAHDHNRRQSGGAPAHADFEEELGEVLLDRDTLCPANVHDSGSSTRRPRDEGSLSSASGTPSPTKRKKVDADLSLREALDTLGEWRREDAEQRKREEAVWERLLEELTKKH